MQIVLAFSVLLLQTRRGPPVNETNEIKKKVGDVCIRAESASQRESGALVTSHPSPAAGGP